MAVFPKNRIFFVFVRLILYTISKPASFMFLFWENMDKETNTGGELKGGNESWGGGDVKEDYNGLRGGKETKYGLKQSI